ncbi:2,3-bisphosphoglycerate-dependent phosphoglycerate mutase [Methylobacterium crusticola]|uniref:2,3-bisphosphoglycerate-dependent phosphoglycerate mutase n=1 Tax=Methylobacterium crusticola TaxID=1697972 RepID=A0ABQ4R9V6_9HYPH|nr:histidine phosphatase family protein [Methylobacterium crusticola]GJD53556.1 2,3-bisphosphoglycerate-dependent phosphoglycerate mutase [Methylobacterium crusticola]
MIRAPIYFVRHGETAWNAEGRLQGQRDTPLNPTGVAQAAEAGRRLRDLLGPRAGSLPFVASPMERTRRTMEGLRAALALDPAAYATDARLKEIGFGAWEGLTWREVRRSDPARASARDRDRWHYRPPGEGAESYAMVADRVRPLLEALDGPVVMVAHGGVARAVMVTLGMASTAEAPQMEIFQGRILVLEAAGRRWA